MIQVVEVTEWFPGAWTDMDLETGRRCGTEMVPGGITCSRRDGHPSWHVGGVKEAGQEMRYWAWTTI